MKRTRKILAILVAVMLLAGLSACGGGEKDDIPNPPIPFDELPEGVTYREDFVWEGDAGEGLSAPEAAVPLFNAAIGYHKYMPDEAYAIVMTGFESIGNGECYLYTFETPDGESKHAVDYFSGVVYVHLDGGWLPIGGAPLDMAGLDEEQAANTLAVALGNRLDGTHLDFVHETYFEGMDYYIFAIAPSGPFFAVGKDGELFDYDLVNGEFEPFAYG